MSKLMTAAQLKQQENRDTRGRYSHGSTSAGITGTDAFPDPWTAPPADTSAPGYHHHVTTPDGTTYHRIDTTIYTYILATPNNPEDLKAPDSWTIHSWYTRCSDALNAAASGTHTRPHVIPVTRTTHTPSATP